MATKVNISVTGVDDVLKTLDVTRITKPMMAKIQTETASLFDELVETSPVDSGTYRSNWTKTAVSAYLIEIANKTPYGKFLVYGTTRWTNAVMRKSYQRADLSRGILHDVRAIVFDFKERVGGLL